MTDNEIVEILDKCLSNGDCTDECSCVRQNVPCVYNEKNILVLIKLIKRQQAEIEGQKKELRACIKEISRNRKIVRNQAITEFAERLKDMHKHNTTSVVSLVTLFGNINKMVEEMTEADNGT